MHMEFTKHNQLINACLHWTESDYLLPPSCEGVQANLAKQDTHEFSDFQVCVPSQFHSCLLYEKIKI